MTTTIGSKGLLNADLIIVQNTTFAVTLLHKDEDGNAIDHTGWSLWCAMRPTSGNTIDLDSYVSFGTNGAIEVLIPDDTTATIAAGPYKWDLIAEDSLGYATRIAYGTANVYDSLARD